MGIRDKHLLYIIRQILKAPIQMPEGGTVLPSMGTPQGGIISPLLANIVLNELDHWIESNWENNPVVYKYRVGLNKNGSPIKSDGYKAMRKTGLSDISGTETPEGKQGASIATHLKGGKGCTIIFVSTFPLCWK